MEHGLLILSGQGVYTLKDAPQGNTIHGSKAVGEPPLMLAISVQEALKDPNKKS